MTQKMPRDERREQLLQLAVEIIKSRGTDSLTLATLAEQAGVTKPVTYRLFGNRQGLLQELSRRYNEQLTSSVATRLASRPHRPDEIAGLFASHYLDCALNCGPAYEAIVAALKAYPEHANNAAEVRDYFVAFLKEILPEQAGAQGQDALYIGLFGAADELAAAVMSGRLGQDGAALALTELIVAALVPAAER